MSCCRLHQQSSLLLVLLVSMWYACLIETWETVIPTTMMKPILWYEIILILSPKSFHWVLVWTINWCSKNTAVRGNDRTTNGKDKPVAVTRNSITYQPNRYVLLLALLSIWHVQCFRFHKLWICIPLYPNG